MKNIASLLKKAESFLARAQDVATEQQKKLEEEKAKMRAKKKEQYELLQEHLDSNPEDLKKYLDNSLQRQKERQTKLKTQDIEGFRTKERQNSNAYYARLKLLKDSGDVEGLLFYARKWMYNLRQQPRSPEETTNIAALVKVFQDWQQTVKELLYGYNPNTPGHVANLNDLTNAIAEGDRLLSHLGKYHKTTGYKALHQLVKKLKDMSDSYTAQGPLTPRSTVD